MDKELDLLERLNKLEIKISKLEKNIIKLVNIHNERQLKIQQDLEFEIKRDEAMSEIGHDM